MFHLVSLSLQISLTDLPGPCLGLCVGVACFVACLGGFVVGFFLTGKFDLNHMLIPVVDRPCLALVRQCRGKKKTSTHSLVTRSQVFIGGSMSGPYLCRLPAWCLLGPVGARVSSFCFS